MDLPLDLFQAETRQGKSPVSWQLTSNGFDFGNLLRGKNWRPPTAGPVLQCKSFRRPAFPPLPYGVGMGAESLCHSCVADLRFFLQNQHPLRPQDFGTGCRVLSSLLLCLCDLLRRELRLVLRFRAWHQTPPVSGGRYLTISHSFRNRNTIRTCGIEY